MSKFSFKKIEELNAVNLIFEGTIDESFGSINLKLHQNKTTRIDFKKVSSINSVGIRNWILWLENHVGVKFIFINCPVCIVEQINNVKGFLPKEAVVESFFLPFYSNSTGEEKLVLCTLYKEFQMGKPPKIPDVFDSEGNLMECDVYTKKYFKFILGV
ncbi:MAG: hypothetical protein L6Q37_00905 [Bdellovibrionaceae bacterium]|nr:hypothetical protein [Pseudobdellovibrionaceae bacterium]NUM58567.1 hypothetical protein [Pseudobdellovibrionaceae bacterium]